MQQPLKLNTLAGYRLQATDGEIGKLDAVYFDDKHWLVRYFIIRSNDWLAEPNQLIIPDAISEIFTKDKFIYVNLSCQQVTNSPKCDINQSLSLDYETDYYRYYNYQPYWHSKSEVDIANQPAPEITPYTPLKNNKQLNHFTIHALDGEIGFVTDLILEQESWCVRYLEINTSNWLPAKHVLLAPAWIDKIDWSNKLVFVSLNCEAIKTAPEYDPTKVISRQYQLELYLHYGKS